MIPGSGLIPLGAWMPTSKIYPCGYYRNRGNRKIDPGTALHDGMPKTGHEFCGISVVVSEQQAGRKHDHGYPWRGRQDFVYRSGYNPPKTTVHRVVGNGTVPFPGTPKTGAQG